jgi:two-component system cell cycle sensor histidine kinase/response regulator CckA
MVHRQRLRVLLLEDKTSDAERLLHELDRAGFDVDWQRVETERDFLGALDSPFDVILADHTMPGFGAPHVLALLRDRTIDIPCVVVSSSFGEEFAIELLKTGASDFLLKDRLWRLGPAIQRAIEERRGRQERARLEEQYRQSQKMEAVGQLAGGIAHDFNNLLTAIEGYCTLIAESGGLDETHQTYIEEVRRAAERASGLTRQLLAFSRRQILELRVIDLRESIVAMEPMLRRLIGENIEVVVGASGDGRVKADPGQIEQVIMNLAINARDAMPNGGALRLEVSPTTIDQPYTRQGTTVVPGQYMLLVVSDTGDGMDAATQARIFEPFFTTKAKGKGTGLGLSTVYGIVKQSGGYIWLDSEPGRGATFKVYLPRVDDAVQPIAAARPSGSLKGSETILVVEDEESVRQLVQRVLQRFGYSVLLASTPTEASTVVRARSGPIHLLISDVVLPQMSGRALAEELLGHEPAMRVLYMSGYTDDAIVHHGVLDQGTPFLQKPFTPDALARKVREVLT